MRSTIQLGAVAVALAAHVACIELDTRVTLGADGSGTVSVHTVLLQSFLDVLEESGKGGTDKLAEKMPTSLPPERLAELTAAGLEITQLGGGATDRGFGWDASLKFSQPSALEAVGGSQGLNAAPSIWIVDLGSGLYEAHLKERASNTSGDGMAEGSDDGGEQKTKSKKEMKKDMEMFGKMMATVKDMKLSYALEVPGTIVSVQPDDGKVAGNTVSWAVSGDMILSALKDPEAAKQDDRSEMTVRFQMPVGQSLPASAISAVPE
jgi:hypothetical protein